MSGRLTFAVLHDDYKIVSGEEALLIRHNVGMLQIFQQASLHHAALLFLLTKARQDDLLGDVLDLFSLVQDEPRTAKVASANALQLLILVLVLLASS